MAPFFIATFKVRAGAIFHPLVNNGFQNRLIARTLKFD